MPTGTWALGWATNDIVSATEFGKGIGSIYDTTLGAGAASIDVTSIVGSYAHLLIVAYLRSDAVVQGVDIVFRLNGDTGSNYGYSAVGSNGSTGTIGSTVSSTSIQATGSALVIPGASATSSGFGVAKFLIPHYAGTANHKGVEYSVGHASATTAPNCHNYTGVGVWRNTAAVTRITLSLSSGNLVIGSRLTIYGMGA